MALTVILEIERKIISRVEGGNDSENRKESSRPCSQPWNNLHLSRELPPPSLPRTPRRFPNRYAAMIRKSKQRGVKIERCYVMLGEKVERLSIFSRRVILYYAWKTIGTLIIGLFISYRK